MENDIFKIIDVSLLQGDMALDSVNNGIVECVCDEFHICQACHEEYEELSDCCGATIYDDIEMCSECKEYCEPFKEDDHEKEN